VGAHDIGHARRPSAYPSIAGITLHCREPPQRANRCHPCSAAFPGIYSITLSARAVSRLAGYYCLEKRAAVERELDA
jgi:hypothetical protein